VLPWAFLPVRVQSLKSLFKARKLSSEWSGLVNKDQKENEVFCRLET
jgi:hypothetical protein